jgi:hypothetical protein
VLGAFSVTNTLHEVKGHCTAQLVYFILIAILFLFYQKGDRVFEKKKKKCALEEFEILMANSQNTGTVHSNSCNSVSFETEITKEVETGHKLSITG